MSSVVPPLVALVAVPVTLPVSGPVKPVAVNIPVDGLKLSFVLVTFAGRLPEFAVTHTGYIVAFVAVSSATPTFVVLVAVPVRAPMNVVAVTVPVTAALREL